MPRWEIVVEDRRDPSRPPRAAVVDKDAGLPLHRQIFLVLHDEIERGSLEPGAPLPTEQALCNQFGVSRITVRRALADLVDEDLIERKHGVGSFVLDRPARRRRDTVAYLDGWRQVDFEVDVEVDVDVEVLDLDVRSAPRAVADRLSSDAKVLYAQRLRYERPTGEPLLLTEVWLPTGLSDVVTDQALTRRPLYGLLTDAGVAVERFDDELSAEVAGPLTARLLATAIGAPLIRLDRVAFADGVPHHVVSIRMSPHRGRILLRQSAEIAEQGLVMAIVHDVHPRT